MHEEHVHRAFHKELPALAVARVVFVIETSEGDTKSGKSKGRESPSVVQGQSPGRGLGNKVPRS